MTGRHMTLKMHSLKSHVIRVTNNGEKIYAVPVLHDFEHEWIIIRLLDNDFGRKINVYNILNI